MAASGNEKLYSRQLYVVGQHGQAMLKKSRALVAGIDSVSLEIGTPVSI
jgi:molybdopterin/thiamine biosynthesis adenylyltransferase